VRACCCVLLAAVLGLAGCSEERQERVGIADISDKVSDEEFERFLNVVKRLPDEKLPEMPPFFGPAPDWSPSRTLPVHDLVKEEEELLRARWSTETMAKHLEHDHALRRALRRAEMTLNEFCNVVGALGIALNHGTLRKNQDPQAILDKAKRPLEQLKKDDRSFSELSREEMYVVLRQAAWIARADRAGRLASVPPENLALARKHAEQLAEIFPIEFSSNPFDPIIDLLEERGLPFEELSDSGSDAEIEWSEIGARRGNDPPDAEFQTKPAKLSTALAPDEAH